METVTLDVQTRDKSMKAKQLRTTGIIPVEYYGNGVENKSLQVEYEVFRKAFRKAGQNTVVEVTVDGKDKMNVLVHKVDLDPVSDRLVHAELINVRMDQEVHTKIAVKLVGVAPAVKELAGTLVQSLHELEIKCLPKDLIHEVELSIEPLVDFHSALHVSDITVPSTITVMNDPSETVVSAAAPKEEKEEEPTEEAAEGEASEGGEAAAEGGEEKSE